VAACVVRYPVPTLAAGVVLFGALGAGLTGYRVIGYRNWSRSAMSRRAGSSSISGRSGGRSGSRLIP